MPSPLSNILRSRTLLLDGAMATELCKSGLCEESFHGNLFSSHPHPLLGNFDILSLSAPEVVAQVHRSYLLAGADIIRTNTFASNRISQRRFATERYVREMNMAAVAIARCEADRFSSPSRPRFVAGTMGPSELALSRCLDADAAVVSSMISDAYFSQSQALIDGGVDLLILETIYDAPSALAAIAGIRRAFVACGVECPLVLSLTVAGSPLSLSSGHTPADFLTMLGDLSPLAVGFNCCSGPSAELIGAVRSLRNVSPYPVVFYPSAGLPDASGSYPLTPRKFASSISPLIANGDLCIVGGCCGTTPSHIRALAHLLESDVAPQS